MVQLAVFGAGRIGQIHARNAAAQPGFHVKYIVDPVEGPARDALAKTTGARIVSAEEVFADPKLHAIVIASSTSSHAPLVHRAAETGKAVFCEKPVSLDFALTQSAVAAVVAAGIPCMLGFQRRYDAAFRALQARVASGEAGRLEHLIMQSRDPAPPPISYVKTSGGMFRDTAIHDVDMARFLLGEEIASVYAKGSCLISPEIGQAGDVDTLMITLTTESGRLAQVINCRRGPMGYDQRLEAVCAREVLRVENAPQGTLHVLRPEGTLAPPPMNYFLERYAQAYRDEMAGFAALITDGTPPLATARDGLEAQRLVEAAIRSHETGQVVVMAPGWRP
ncbi:inositol 2-dehydrogenase [Salipiger mangrovisoli]|uniref:inositol 2-dehydrogenase n=1 Tax=Salipiger mangrovisoli TaxID=2865933 RepID=UPI001F11AF61|nr:inositol 2-dehydrogenase [Salipiger mangrovisoli]